MVAATVQRLCLTHRQTQASAQPTSEPELSPSPAGRGRGEGRRGPGKIPEVQRVPDVDVKTSLGAMALEVSKAEVYVEGRSAEKPGTCRDIRSSINLNRAP
jgi:hypothetical protein